MDGLQLFHSIRELMAKRQFVIRLKRSVSIGLRANIAGLMMLWPKLFYNSATEEIGNSLRPERLIFSPTWPLFSKSHEKVIKNLVEVEG